MRQELPLYLGITAGGVATACAAVVTNVPEVAKSRLQVDAQLSKDPGKRKYTSFPQALARIAREEGVRGLQAGLPVAMVHQFFLNGSRLGTYTYAKEVLNGPGGERRARYPRAVALGNVAASAAAGALGALVSSPLMLTKIRLQTGELKRGTGLVRGLAETARARGVAGLWRGATVSMGRTALGSAVQLTSYEQAKRVLTTGRAGLDPGAVSTHFASSVVAGVCVATAMQPADVVMTRVMNDRAGMYRGAADCFVRTARAEGLRGFYRGWTAMTMRLCPHTILTFILFERIKQVLGYDPA